MKILKPSIDNFPNHVPIKVYEYVLGNFQFQLISNLRIWFLNINKSVPCHFPLT